MKKLLIAIGLVGAFALAPVVTNANVDSNATDVALTQDANAETLVDAQRIYDVWYYYPLGNWDTSSITTFCFSDGIDVCYRRNEVYFKNVPGLVRQFFTEGRWQNSGN